MTEFSTHGEDQSSQPVASTPASVTEWFDMAAAQVAAFFGQLRRVPIGTWCRLADADPHITVPRAGAGWLSPTTDPASEGLAEEQADRVARARLREVIEGMPSVARRIRRRIDNEIGVVAGIAPPEMVSRMRRAARLAACAIAARPWLSPEEFARLYRPFAELIPLENFETQQPLA